MSNVKPDEELVRYVLARGGECEVLVEQCSEVELPLSSDLDEILDALRCTDLSWLKIYENDEFQGAAMMVYGNDDDEIMADHSDNEWFAAYFKSGDR